ncbi:MAG: PLP-dependent aminotransferase family protein [Micromonosporaceae bacterium]
MGETLSEPQAEAAVLAERQLHRALGDPALNSMNFLNEVAARYPDAISFAAGRPYEEFFDLEQLHRALRRFCQHLGDDLGFDQDQVTRTLFQYGRTKGITHHLIARHLRIDEQIDVDPEAIVVTVGCQEAMFLVLRALRADPTDVVLAVAPTYVGLTGAARLVEMPVAPVASGPAGVDFDHLTAQLRQTRERGLRPRACYVSPDFANPSGVSLDLAARRRLLQIADEHDILLLEDNPYGLFHADGESRQPTLKALDRGQRVVYLGSFAKTVLPGARVGYVIADQRVRHASADTGAAHASAGPAAGTLLADQLSKIKSMLTVNTSAIAQAVVGGSLLEHDCSLVAANQRERTAYARNLRLILDGLTARFAGTPGVTWNVPTGGFFLVVTTPFPVDDRLLDRAGRDYGVLFTPMSHFYDGVAPVNALRLSASVVTPQQIDAGLDRLAALIRDQIEERHSAHR